MGNTCCSSPKPSTTQTFEALERSGKANTTGEAEVIKAQLNSVTIQQLDTAGVDVGTENPLGTTPRRSRRRHTESLHSPHSGDSDHGLTIQVEEDSRCESERSLSMDRGSLHTPLHSAGASTVAYLDPISPVSTPSRISAHQSLQTSLTSSPALVMPNSN